ncbi:hypothetical protein U9M48_037807, partial [Paspalum notatum var. saurae]
SSPPKNPTAGLLRVPFPASYYSSRDSSQASAASSSFRSRGAAELPLHPRCRFDGNSSAPPLYGSCLGLRRRRAPTRNR